MGNTQGTPRTKAPVTSDELTVESVHDTTHTTREAADELVVESVRETTHTTLLGPLVVDISSTPNARYFELIHHENELMNQRMTWFLLIQGLLLNGVGDYCDTNQDFLAVLSIVGILTSLSFACVVGKCYNCIKKLYSEGSRRYGGSELDHFPIIGRASQGVCCDIFDPWFVMPFAFLVAWASLLYFTLKRL